MAASYWPVVLIVLSNVLYHVCAKSAPSAAEPFASLTVTYAVGAAVSATLFFLLRRGVDPAAAYRRIHWTAVVLGVAIVGLEAGYLYLYKAGWAVSTAQIFCSALLAVCLLAVGCVFYHEVITVTKLAGITVCMLGLFLLNR